VKTASETQMMIERNILITCSVLPVSATCHGSTEIYPDAERVIWMRNSKLAELQFSAESWRGFGRKSVHLDPVHRSTFNGKQCCRYSCRQT
jgi:hypothetical protein